MFARNSSAVLSSVARCASRSAAVNTTSATVQIPRYDTFKQSVYTPSSAFFHSTRATFERKRDYYEVLGVPKNADADTIKKAYFALAKKYHPDASKEPDAQQKFAEISSAYDVLRDEQKRAKYDQFGHDAEQFEQAGYGPPPGFNPEDLIREMFFGGRMGGMGMDGFDFGGEMGGGRSNRPRQGNDVQTQLNVSFMEAVHGCQKTITVRTRSPCTTCDGSGTKAGAKATTCNKCGGTGVVRLMKGMFQIETHCTACNGAGKSTPQCIACGGETTVAETKKVTVTIPAGVDSNTNLRLVNQGDAGFKNGPRGHLWVKLQVDPDKRFRREGNDVHITVPLSLPQAVLGSTVEVPTLTGSAMLKVPAGTQPKDTSVMRNKGIKMVNRDYHGHQYIHFDIQIPKHLTATARELMEQFSVEMGLDKDVHITKKEKESTEKKETTDKESKEEEEEDNEDDDKKKKGLFSRIFKDKK